MKLENTKVELLYVNGKESEFRASYLVDHLKSFSLPTGQSTYPFEKIWTWTVTPKALLDWADFVRGPATSRLIFVVQPELLGADASTLEISINTVQHAARIATAHAEKESWVSVWSLSDENRQLLSQALERLAHTHLQSSGQSIDPEAIFLSQLVSYSGKKDFLKLTSRTGYGEHNFSWQVSPVEKVYKFRDKIPEE